MQYCVVTFAALTTTHTRIALPHLMRAETVEAKPFFNKRYLLIFLAQISQHSQLITVLGNSFLLGLSFQQTP